MLPTDMFVITFSVVSSQPLLQRVTLPYTSTAALLSPHNTLCHQSTPPLKSPTFMPPEPLIPHPNRYSGNPITTFSPTVLQNNDILWFSFSVLRKPIWYFIHMNKKKKTELYIFFNIHSQVYAMKIPKICPINDPSVILNCLTSSFQGHLLMHLWTGFSTGDKYRLLPRSPVVSLWL